MHCEKALEQTKEKETNQQPHVNAVMQRLTPSRSISTVRFVMTRVCLRKVCLQRDGNMRTCCEINIYRDAKGKAYCGNSLSCAGAASTLFQQGLHKLSGGPVGSSAHVSQGLVPRTPYAGYCPFDANCGEQATLRLSVPRSACARALMMRRSGPTTASG